MLALAPVGFVTVTVRRPVAAVGLILMTAARSPALTHVTLCTLILLPKLTVAPLWKPPPNTCTVICCPRFPVPGLQLDTDSVDDEFTVVTTCVLLFAVLGSTVLALTDAEFVIAPATFGVTTMVTVALPPFAIVPRLQLTVAPPVHVPCDGVAEPNVMLEGSVSVTLTPHAAFGPALVTVSVYVRLLPTVTGLGLALFVIPRSACGGGVPPHDANLNEPMRVRHEAELVAA